MLAILTYMSHDTEIPPWQAFFTSANISALPLPNFSTRQQNIPLNSAQSQSF